MEASTRQETSMSTAGDEIRGARLEETKRTSRVLEIVQMIAVAPRRYRRRSLAERFEISDTYPRGGA
jgi:hypothetical protein